MEAQLQVAHLTVKQAREALALAQREVRAGCCWAWREAACVSIVHCIAVPTAARMPVSSPSASWATPHVRVPCPLLNSSPPLGWVVPTPAGRQVVHPLST